VSSRRSSDNDSDSTEAAADAIEKEAVMETLARCKRGRKVVTSQLSASLDRTKVSNRKAVFVIAETIKSLGDSIDNYTLNTESVRRQLLAHQTLELTGLKDEFKGGGIENSCKT